MTTPAVQARHAEQQASDAAYTRCVAAEIALRRLHAEQTVDIAAEQQGELSHSEEAIRLRMVRGQATPSDYRAFARMSNRRPNPALADASGASQPGRTHFDSDADYRAARTWSR